MSARFLEHVGPSHDDDDDLWQGPVKFLQERIPGVGSNTKLRVVQAQTRCDSLFSDLKAFADEKVGLESVFVFFTESCYDFLALPN